MAFKKFMSGFYDVQAQLPEYIKNKAIEAFDKEENIKENITDIISFEKRRNYIKEYFINAIGGLDFEKSELNPICNGEIEREKYVIKKIIFQSHPGVYVTSNLYLPKLAEKKTPCILFACGHGKPAKAYSTYQQACIDLASNGFTVLAVDPFGQGERMQYYDPESKKLLVDWGITEHTYTGLQCNLLGANVARYMIWDLMRAIDYLETLPEIDPQRIGMTGSSGGGTQTSYMMMVDERIKAAAPCTYITSRLEYMKTGQPHDSEQNIYGAITEGLNYDDFISCFAPKPALIGAVESDFFCIEGALKSFERAKKTYSFYGREENIALAVKPGTHSYNHHLRQAVVNWFILHLKNEEPDFLADIHLPFEKPEDLRCTKSGQVLGDFPDAIGVFELNKKYLKKHKYIKENDKEILKNKVKQSLNLPEGNITAFYPRIISEKTQNDKLERDIFFFSEKDITVGGTLIEKINSDKKYCTIYVSEKVGIEESTKENEAVEKLINKGPVFIFNTRGSGALKSREVNDFGYERMFGTKYKLNCDAAMLKTSLSTLKIFDVIQACKMIHQTYPEKKIIVTGTGICSVYSVITAFLEDRVDGIYYEGETPSFENMATNRFYEYDVLFDIYGILKSFDIPTIVEAIKNKEIKI